MGGKGSVSFSAHISQICQYVVTIFSTQTAAETPASLLILIADCFLGVWGLFIMCGEFFVWLGFCLFIFCCLGFF